MKLHHAVTNASEITHPVCSIERCHPSLSGSLLPEGKRSGSREITTDSLKSGEYVAKPFLRRSWTSSNWIQDSLKGNRGRGRI